jgi:hypothetical protein
MRFLVEAGLEANNYTSLQAVFLSWGGCSHKSFRGNFIVGCFLMRSSADTEMEASKYTSLKALSMPGSGCSYPRRFYRRLGRGGGGGYIFLMIYYWLCLIF